MIAFTRQKDFLVGIDSDGCAFDTMELKHKECFIPNIIYYYNLQGVSKYAREVAEFVNLYSKSRGINRFPALIETLERLRRRPEVKARGVKINVPESLRNWIKSEKKLGNPALEQAVQVSGDPDLRQALEWSRAVNKSVEWMVKGVPPFPFVRESLQRLSEVADIMVVSATPEEALKREWAEHDLDKYVRAILGQESGTKKDFLAFGAQYPPGHTLMVGDAPGDQKAAEANNALFFPVNPGEEEKSWREFFHVAIDRFINGTFAGDYQTQLIAEFDRCLPVNPPWVEEAED